MYTREQKLKALETLPPDLKDAIRSVETTDKIQKIGGEQSLMLDQVTELAEEVSLLILGLTKTKNFLDNIEKRLNISHDKAVLIVDSVNKEIIYPIKISIQSIQEGTPTPPPIRPVIKAPVPPPPVQTAIVQSQNVIPPNLPGQIVQMPQKPSATPFIRPVENKVPIKVEKPAPTEEQTIHDDISKIEEIGNFKIDRPRPDDPYREPLI